MKQNGRVQHALSCESGLVYVCKLRCLRPHRALSSSVAFGQLPQQEVSDHYWSVSSSALAQWRLTEVQSTTCGCWGFDVVTAATVVAHLNTSSKRKQMHARRHVPARVFVYRSLLEPCDRWQQMTEQYHVPDSAQHRNASKIFTLPAASSSHHICGSNFSDMNVLLDKSCRLQFILRGARASHPSPPPYDCNLRCFPV